VRARHSNRGKLAAVALVVCGLALAFSPTAWTEGRGHLGGNKVTCHGRASLDGFFHVRNDGKVTGKRVKCKTARKVVKRFPKKCVDAYAGQGRCKVPASGSGWKCRSRIVGDLEDGAPSKEKCKHRRSRIKFKVAYFPPTETNLPPPAGARAPFNAAGKCIDLTDPNTPLPPPEPRSKGNFQIRLLSGVPRSVGEGLQQALVSHRVSPILHAGLGSEPRNDPRPIPILLTAGNFNAAADFGDTGPVCQNRSLTAMVLRTNVAADVLASTAAHELFHAYSFGLLYQDHNTWWEEASATWSPARAGFPEDELFDFALQFPNRALDTLRPNEYRYAMSRFVQFLDDRGLLGEPAWPLQREVITGYRVPGTTKALAEALARRVRTQNPLGALLAAFWGDRLRIKPAHGDGQLRPSPANSKRLVIEPGTSTVTAGATDPLHTRLLNFVLADAVKRVEFEFDPGEGYFWGGVGADDVRRFFADDSVTFCVGGGSAGELDWPPLSNTAGEYFPVTFTNGNRAGAGITGEITIHAQTDADQCQPPTPDNRACKVLSKASVSGLLGPGSFPFHSQHRDGDAAIWICFYTGSQGEVNFNLARSFNRSAQEVRRGVRRQIEQLGLERLDAGDLAGIGSFTDDDGKTFGIVVMAVGRENALFIIGPGAQRQNARTLAKRVAGQID
jgi:hypothetical protein